MLSLVCARTYSEHRIGNVLDRATCTESRLRKPLQKHVAMRSRTRTREHGAKACARACQAAGVGGRPRTGLFLLDAVLSLQLLQLL